MEEMKKMVNSFEDFPVYKKALESIEQVNNICNKVKCREFYFLKDQIRRASSSIVLNIAEGSGKWTKRDKINFYRISRASAFECIGALDLFKAYRLIEEQEYENVREKFGDVSGSLQALIYSIEKRIK
jgi:four helix bundle protein